MVTKEKNAGEPEEKSGRVKMDKLELNKETVEDLTGSEKKQVQGGARRLRSPDTVPTAGEFTCGTAPECSGKTK